MRLYYADEQKRYELESGYHERQYPKEAGFRWDPTKKLWWTDRDYIAAKLISVADPSVAAHLKAQQEAEKEALAASRATDYAGEVPCPEGLSYLPFQKAGIAYAMQRGSTLIADQMGLGKTIQAIGVVNSDDLAQRVVIICPASLKLNWEREFQKWSVRPCAVTVLSGTKADPDVIEAAWGKQKVLEKKKGEPVSVIIVNYDVLHAWQETIKPYVYDVLIADEAHLCKNEKTRRAKNTFLLSHNARRRVFLTGTPIVNRPIELWPIIHHLDPAAWPNFFSYAKRYADAHHNGYGWDFKGAANLGELQTRLRSTLMVRRLKEDVLTELPPKVRQVIPLPDNGCAAIVAKEKAAWQKYQDTLLELKTLVELAKASDDPDAYKSAVEKLREGCQVAFTEMSQVRHEVALAKVPYVVTHILENLEGSDKIIVFGHHKDVIAAILKALDDQQVEAVSITGSTSMQARQNAVDSFQKDPQVKVFVGNILAAGVGLTLTASSHVIFAELDWVPGNVTQAEDRAHRIGQKDSVLVQHIVLDGSLDSNMAKTLVAKQSVIDRALDTEPKEAAEIAVEPLLPLEEPIATHTTTKAQVEKEAPTLSEDQVAAIHLGLQMLAGTCDGAFSEDGIGFSKVDTRIGKSLANAYTLTNKQAVLGLRLCNKYRRQLPTDLLAVAKGELV